MFEIVTPRTLFRTQIHTLRCNLPVVLDGLPNGIHDARIATRRIRELLPLFKGPKHRSGIQDLHDRFKRLGRSLGRVRDADVRVALLASLETRIPHAAPSLVILRQHREQERLTLLRKLIKRLERLDAVRLVESLDDHRLSWPGSHVWSLRAGGQSRRDLRDTLSLRAQATCEAIGHATGVYFPARAHAARIAIKKLRYSMEIANETGGGDRTSAIRELKKAQDLLGDLHDRQELMDSLAKGAATDTSDAAKASSDAADQVAVVRQVIEAECRELHERYLARRQSLLEICREEQRGVIKPRAATPSLVTAGVLALSAGVFVTHRLHSGSSDVN